MNDDEIRKIIAVRVANGSLPRDLVQSLGGGSDSAASAAGTGIAGAKPNPGLSCAACEENKADLAIMKAEKSFPFHARCLYVYQDEMAPVE